MKHDTEVKLFVGSAEVVARTRIIGQKQIKPGQKGWLQLALREPVAVFRGDRFIIRRPSPPATLGGGVILDPHPGRRHKRYSPHVALKFKTLESGTPKEILLLTLQRNEPLSKKSLFDISGLDSETAEQAWQTLQTNEEVIIVSENILYIQ